MTQTKRPSAAEFRIDSQVLAGVVLWSLVAVLCAILANVVGVGLPQ
jgi:hypothetical protein